MISLLSNPDKTKNFYQYCEELKRPFNICHGYLMQHDILMEKYSEGKFFSEEFIPTLEPKELDAVYQGLQFSHSNLLGAINEKLPKFVGKLEPKNIEDRKNKFDALELSEHKLQVFDEYIESVMDMLLVQQEISKLNLKLGLVSSMLELVDMHMTQSTYATTDQINAVDIKITSDFNLKIEDSDKRSNDYYLKLRNLVIAIGFTLAVIISVINFLGMYLIYKQGFKNVIYTLSIIVGLIGASSIIGAISYAYKYFKTDK